MDSPGLIGTASEWESRCIKQILCFALMNESESV